MLTAAQMTASQAPAAREPRPDPGLQPRAEVWLGHIYPQVLGRPDARWPTVRRELDTLQFAINSLAFLIPREELRDLVRVLQRSRTKIAIECGYFDWESTITDFSTPNRKGISDRVRAKVMPGVGAATARVEMAKIAHLTACGARPDYLVLDGPVRRLLHPGADTGRATPHGKEEGLPTLDAAVTEVIEYMREWRRRYPEVQFMALTNFPNWGWKGGMSYQASGPDGKFWGDYYPVVTALIDRAKEAGLPFAGVTCDNPYEYAMGTIEFGPPWPAPMQRPSAVDWMARVLDLERTVESRRTKFNMIINAQGGGGRSDADFSRETLAYLDAYRRAGGSPARYTFQTWYKHPSRLEPDDDATTMTGMIREAIRRLRGR